jgi:hypothetical protein
MIHRRVLDSRSREFGGREALVWAPAAFRKHGVYLAVSDLEAA